MEGFLLLAVSPPPGPVTSGLRGKEARVGLLELEHALPEIEVPGERGMPIGLDA
eukprot:CAMPEP_0184319222 /NCGR_PEP_ID=MMETSP1049-20130417/107141_1 /TAXON_ID=77928 /ORGANISM="Proteomonas sulcata, Strain CCMP704" /LENGTH=53 /DNA_ID=CAMNT_0026639275 /DNA_START=299 /DNA_END=460 /DNA_ORIENTATION=-